MLAELAVAAALTRPSATLSRSAGEGHSMFFSRSGGDGRRDGARPAGGTPAVHAFGPPPSSAAGPAASPPPLRGKEIYRTGAGTALVGETRVSAAIVPCASCHGADGRGRAEGGVRPPDIRRTALTKPYAAPYDDRLLRRAITTGVSSSGKRLNPVMPRYELPRADLDALIAYLHVLGDEAVPGVTDTTIRAGVVLPPAARAPLEAWVKNFNANGGVYGRTLDVRYADPGVDNAAFMRDNDLFAIFASYAELTDVERQARALARFAAERGTAVAVVGRGPAADAFMAEARALGMRVVDGDQPVATLVLGDAPPPKSAPLVLAIGALGGAAAFSESSGVAHAVAFPPSPIESAEAFARALRAVGVDLTRERFLEAAGKPRVSIVSVDEHGRVTDSRQMTP
jgi:mono/diheme cytochrome c family protein